MMHKEDFFFNMKLKYSAGQKSKNAEKRNDLFSAELNTFMKYCPEIHLEDVFNNISRSVKENYIPSMKHFYDYAEEMEFIPKGTVKKKKKPYWCVCADCGKEYGFRSRLCPSCGSLKFRVKSVAKFTDSIPAHIDLLQEDCTVCSVYEKRNDDRNYVFGPECNSYGLGTKSFDNCKDCSCKVCCSQYHELTDNWRRFKSRMKQGQHKMPWLDMSKLEKKIVNGGKN